MMWADRNLEDKSRNSKFRIKSSECNSLTLDSMYLVFTRNEMVYDCMYVQGPYYFFLIQ